MMARAVRRAVKRVLAATVAWSVLGAPAAGGEWRSWCGEPDASTSLGWHFYCDQREEPPEAEQVPPPPSAGPVQSATERILELRKALEEARAEAILSPTMESVTAYLRLQQETLQRAAVFSDAFRRTVWATPELDYTLKRPVGALAKRVWSD
ncbi:MAG: conjugal transfer protein TraF, partial [Alphaproteobacteria bacterium]|nr:conjugal transfer protein TraF [Alphaproteobacteria bacterium]